MVQPNDVTDQLEEDHFKPDKYIAVFFGMSKYDRVSQIQNKDADDQEIKPGYEYFPQAEADCNLLMKYL